MGMTGYSSYGSREYLLTAGIRLTGTAYSRMGMGGYGGGYGMGGGYGVGGMGGPGEVCRRECVCYCTDHIGLSTLSNKLSTKSNSAGIRRT